MIRRTAMTKFNKKLTNQISQAGSLMIEAMAMLALISLVTPTLYKKSAERTSELQDINTATHMRTLIKAVDNYVATNYDEMLKTISDGGYHQINAEDLADYLPYGYDINSEVKNFGQPRIALHRQTNGITSYVELPKKADIGTMRAARIASMVGSNGGFVNGENNAEGVGGIWSLNKDQLTDENGLRFTGTPNSIVVTSSEAITSSTSAALENDKYLQRTKVDSPNQKWRNTMTTDLYMGGITSADGSDTTAMHKILGVDQLIIGSADTAPHTDGLVVTGNDDEGSAWIEGALRASNKFLTVEDNSFALGKEETSNIMFANANIIEMFHNSSNSDGLVLNSEDATLTTDYNLTSTGNTYLANTADKTFVVGQKSSPNIYATDSKLSLRNNQLVLEEDKEPTNSVTTIKGKQTNINSGLSIGSNQPAKDYENPNPDKHENLNPQLYVNGNTYVDGTLYSKNLETEKFDTLELHAGGSAFGDTNNRWLHATANGVKVTDSNNKDRLNINESIIKIQNNDKNNMERAYLQLLNDDVALFGKSRVNITSSGTSDQSGVVSIQDNLLTAIRAISKNPNDDANIRFVDVNGTLTVNNSSFNVHSEKAGKEVLSVQTAGTTDNEGTVDIDALTVGIKSQNLYANRDNFTVISSDANNSNSRKKLEITQTKETNKASQVLINADGFLVNHNKELGSILEVDTLETDTSSKAKKGSVYIRKGAIEVEKSSDNDHAAAADEGYGYVSASRFVANNDNVDPRSVYPKNNNLYNANNQYDKYMVNPAYTSVMHDIKLTTRGGARLSDILPDFINKGIYVVNNTFKEDNCSVKSSGSYKCDDVENQDDLWVSPYLGHVPAPLCPPGYMKVITVTPAGFMMGQAGNLRKNGEKWYVDETENMYRIAQSNVELNNDSGSSTILTSTPSLQQTNISSTDTIYYLGYLDANAIPKIGDSKFSPAPLYFQQSTWLKSKVQPIGEKDNICDSNTCDGFIGWAAIMGYLYPAGLYKDIYNKLTGNTLEDSEVAWNLFPVRAKTLEAYATVYCYFDSTGNYTKIKTDTTMIDQYDQMKNFRTEKSNDKNIDYIKRLNDPTLKYDSAW